MDVGVFKASRTRLMMWIIVPPLLVVGIGLGTYTLKLQSEWQLSRTKELAEVLPDLIDAQQQAQELLAQFNKGLEQSVESEDQFISFLQEVAQQVGFTVDSIKVERRVSAATLNTEVLFASVKGTGSFDVIELYLNDVVSAHTLLSESEIKLTQVKEYNTDFYRAELAFELLLYKGSRAAIGSAK